MTPTEGGTHREMDSWTTEGGTHRETDSWTTEGWTHNQQIDGQTDRLMTAQTDKGRDTHTQTIHTECSLLCHQWLYVSHWDEPQCIVHLSLSQPQQTHHPAVSCDLSNC